jgi:hypothetical protein
MLYGDRGEKGETPLLETNSRLTISVSGPLPRSPPPRGAPADAVDDEREGEREAGEPQPEQQRLAAAEAVQPRVARGELHLLPALEARLEAVGALQVRDHLPAPPARRRPVQMGRGVPLSVDHLRVARGALLRARPRLLGVLELVPAPASSKWKWPHLRGGAP